jgi:ubiquitin carboxyl-terminal hydrolase 8
MNFFEKYKNKGLTGLVNVGNTCYLNSCMQILSHTYELNNLLDNINYNNLNEDEDKILISEWNDLRNLMWSQNCCISPGRFVNSVQIVSKNKNKELFCGYLQNDIQEYILFVIDTFHNSIKRKVKMNIVGNVKNDNDKMALECYKIFLEEFGNNYSEFIKLFFGTQVSLLTSIDTNDILSIKPEPFLVLNLPIPNINTEEEKKVLSIYDCLDEYCKIEVLENDNAWFNEETNKKENVNKNLIFWSLPEILIIDLKRWNIFNGYVKNNTYIDIPVTDLNMNKYSYNNMKFEQYDLYGICNHIGNINGGHYTAYIKNANNKWYSFDDNSVNNMSDSEILSNNAYCLFYRKKKS